MSLLQNGTDPIATSRRGAVLALLTLSYFLSGKAGLQLAFAHPYATPVWPPTGLALAALLVWGWRLWPAIFLGAFLVNFTIAGRAATSAGIAVGNTLEAVLGSYLVQRYAGGRFAFEKPEGVFLFTGLAGLLSTTVGAAVGVTGLCLGGEAAWSHWSSIGLTWWLGDAGGALVVTPVLLLWSARPADQPQRGSRLEAVLLLAAVAFIGWAVFGDLLPIAPARYPLEFLCLPVLVWAAFRFGPRDSAAIVMALGAIAVVGTLKGFGPFAREEPAVALLLLQACLAVGAVVTLALAAAVLAQRRDHRAVLAAQDRLQALERQRAAQEMLTRWLEDFPAMIWRCGVDGNPDYVNRRWFAFTGRSLEEERGAGWLNGLHPDDREGCEAAWNAAFASRAPFEHEYRLRRSDGAYRWVVDHGRPIAGADGAFAGYIGGCFDVTERRRHEEAKTRFIANAAHELRTPVAAIVALAELLGEFHATLTDAQFEQQCRLLGEQGLRLRRLITSLLDLSRVEQGLEGLARRAVPVAGVARLALESAPPPIGTSFRIEVPEGLSVMADAAWLEQVLVNLLTNAWHHGGPTVALEAEASPAEVLFVVQDDGAGIPGELVPHLFEPFARGPGAVHPDGSGLGLAIARGIVEALGGAIWYEPARPRGSRFVVRLPRAA